MYYERGAIIIQKVDDPDDPVAGPAADHKPFLLVTLARKSVFGVPHDDFNFRDRATMLCRVLAVPVDPSELGRGHYLTIYESRGPVKSAGVAGVRVDPGDHAAVPMGLKTGQA
jgi:hypothetical protein